MFTQCTIKNKNLIKFLCLTVICLSMAACAKSENPAQEQAMGGVDGSGGNLPFLDAGSFDEWVANDHQYYVRDLIYRLEQLRKFSPKDLERIPYDLPNRFLGEKEGDLQKIADKLTYHTTPGACPASNNASSDASITPEGKVCFSYRAFRNLAVKDAIPKLLSMTMHELSHLRGFNEEDAMRWQLVFDRTVLGKQTILFFNDNHRSVKKSLEKASRDLSASLSFLLEREAISKKLACKYITQAEVRASDINYTGQDIPKFLYDLIKEKIHMPLLNLDIGCEDQTNNEISSKLVSLLNAVEEVAIKFEQYESPFCTGELCVGTRLNSGFDNSILLEWNAKKDFFASRKPYPKTSMGKMGCTLKDLTEDKNIELVKDEFGSFDLKKINPENFKSGASDIWIKEMDKKSGVKIEFNHRGNVQLMEASGFKASSYNMVGELFSGVVNRVSLKFALMNPHLKPTKKIPGEIVPGVTPDYSFMDAYFYAIPQMPTIVKEFQLDCELK